MAKVPTTSEESGSTSLSLDFGDHEIDISQLSPKDRAEIEKYAALKKIDLKTSIAELQRDIQATSAGMNTVADVTRRMTESGDAVTVRQTINNEAGKIEIVAGNTDEAKKGRTSMGADNTWLYLLAGVGAAIGVALILAGS